jgi:TonB family protein
LKKLLCAAALLAGAPLAAQDAAPADSAPVYEVAQVPTRPRATNVPDLLAALQTGYPEELRAAGRDGRVVVSMVIGTDGAPRTVNVVSSTDPGFDSATVEAVRQLRFTPGALQDGRAVAVRVEVPVQWTLPPEDEIARLVGAMASGPERRGPDAEGIYEIGGVEERPQPRNLRAMLWQMDKLYPDALRRVGLGGLVVVHFQVDVEGRVQRARIIESARDALNEPSLQAVQTLRFRPARLNGRPVPVWVALPIYWSPSPNADPWRPQVDRIEPNAPPVYGTVTPG